MNDFSFIAITVISDFSALRSFSAVSILCSSFFIEEGNSNLTLLDIFVDLMQPRLMEESISVSHKLWDEYLFAPFSCPRKIGSCL